MDPFLSVVASAFPGRAGILYYKGQAKPEGCYPNRPAGGTRRGPGNHTTAVEKACSFPRRIPLPSSSLSLFGWGKREKGKRASALLRAYACLAGILSSLIQIGVGLFGLNRGSNMICWSELRHASNTKSGKLQG